jgi:FG-GAP repeat protein
VGTPDDLQYCPGAPGGPTTCRLLATLTATSALAIANVNGDRYDDLVQGDEADDRRKGLVWLPLGGRGGLGIPKRISQDDLGIDSAEAGDEFGHDVVAGDLDGDHLADVVVAARSDRGGQGSLSVIPGTRNGLGLSRAFMLSYSVPIDTQLGATLTLLDLDRDGHPELFAGIKDAPLAQNVIQFRGTENGLSHEGEAAGPSAEVAKVKAGSPLRLGR